MPIKDLSKNERCFIRILEHAKKGLMTNEVLEFTKKFPKLCVGCVSGTHVISAGIRLRDKDIITRSIVKGGFIWTLNEKTR